MDTLHPPPLPHQIIQQAADRLAFYTAGASPSPWRVTQQRQVISDPSPREVSASPTTYDSQSSLDAEYIALMQPDLASSVADMLFYAAATHRNGDCYYCSYTEPHPNCPYLRIANVILCIDQMLTSTHSDSI